MSAESLFALHLTRGQRVLSALRIAINRNPGVPTTHFPMKQDAGTPTTARFPTGIRKLDRMTGGGYGVTVISGAPKMGKSFAAVACALEAAAEGIRVIYLNAEMPIEQTAARFGRYLRAFPRVDVSPRALAVLDVVQPLSASGLVNELENIILDYSDERILLVIDSVNSLVRNLGGDQLAKIESVLMFLIRARRLAPNDFSALAVCELNQRGHVKGLSAEYLADLLVRLRRTEQPGAQGVEIDVQLSRESQSGPIGRHLLDPTRGCFLCATGDVEDRG